MGRTAYQTDRDGMFAGVTEADESPLEPWRVPDPGGGGSGSTTGNLAR